MQHRFHFRMSAGAAALAIAILGSFAVTASEPSTNPPSGSMSSLPRWNLAVVFRREKSERTYVGTVSDPVVPARAQGSMAQQEPTRPAVATGSDVDYEIWLAGVGVARGLWYSSSKRLWGDLSISGEFSNGSRDDGSLSRLIQNAHPALAERPPRADTEAIATFVPPSPTLEILCRASSIIAVGRVAGILRQGHTPINNPDFDQHTVFAFAVEQYLKTDVLGARPVLKVWQTGGSLAWTNRESGARGVGFVIKGDPMLNVGDRYILFLRRTAGTGDLRLGYVYGEAGGFQGKIGELDEYPTVNNWQAKVLLRNGVTQAPQLLGTPDDHWRFRSGPQILDVPEAVAIQTIRQQLAQKSP